MELTAVFQGLPVIGPDDAVDVYTDSRLVVDTPPKWAAGWKRNGRRRRDAK